MNLADAQSASSARAKPSAALLHALIALMVIVWALNFVVGKIALRQIPPLVLPGVRIGIAAIFFIPIYWWDRRGHTHRPFRRADLPQLIVVALCGITFNQFFFIAGLYRTSVGHMAVFFAMTPVIVLLLAVIIGQEKLTFPKLAGMLIAMTGVLLVELSSQRGSRIATPLGDLFAFLGNLAFSIYTVAGKHVASRYGSIPVNTLAYAIGAATLLPISWAARGSFHAAEISAAAWLSLLYMVIFGSVVAYLIYYYALMHIPASRVAAFTYAEPVLAAILGFLLLGEPVTWALGVGGAMVLAGVWIAERPGRPPGRAVLESHSHTGV